MQPNSSAPKDKFGDDLMIKAETTPQGADKAARIIAVCRGIRHILTPVAWINSHRPGYRNPNLLEG